MGICALTGNTNYKECIYGMTEDDVKVIVEDDTKETDDDGLIYECIYAQSAKAIRKKKSKHGRQIEYVEKKERKVICCLCYERGHWNDASGHQSRNPDELLHNPTANREVCFNIIAREDDGIQLKTYGSQDI